jgi:hypothetical protein
MTFLLILECSQIGSIDARGVSNTARIAVAWNLQLLSQILDTTKRSSWAFSLANDGSTHYGTSYFDNRIRIHIAGKLHNLHAIAIPMFEEHSGENMFLLVCRFFDVICPQWRTQLIGIGSDGASAMTGRMQGVVTRLVKECNHKVYRVWCGLHQLDLVLKHAYKELWDNEVVDIMKKFIAHLRRQDTLIDAMQATCPKLSTRWLVMGIVSDWLLANRIRLFEYIDAAKEPISQAPPNWWWVIIAGIKALTDIINPVYVKLQAKNLLISTQATLLEGLARDICMMIGIEGPFSSDEIDALSVGFNCTYGRWSVSYERVMEFLEDQGMYSRKTLQGLSDELHRKVIQSIGQLITRIVEGIINIQAERNERNHAADDLPPVLPHELVKLSTRNYGNTVVDLHLEQLHHSWKEEDIAEIENEHRRLRIAYQTEPVLKSALDVYEATGITSFETGWALVEGRFEVLRDFCGGIATVFANTASVESDFSIINWEKDLYRLSLTDLSLEGIMQCKQHKLLSLLVNS